MPRTPIENVDLRVRIKEMEMRNPLMLASGILGETADLLIAAYEAGAGAVVTKSIGSEPRKGHSNPTIFQYPFGLLNAMGLPNPGIDEFEKEMKKLKRAEAVVISSIFGSNSNEFVFLARKMEDFGAIALELNLSCPHAEGVGAEIGSDPSTVREIVSSVVATVHIPVFAKLTPNTSDIVALGQAAQEGGASAVVAINTVRAIAVDPYLRKPALGNVFGGLSGSAIKPIGLRCVYELYDSLTIPIVGVGGIGSGIDVAEYLMAGAFAVQIGTLIQTKGLNAFPEIRRELEEFMQVEGFNNLSEIRGAAHE